MKWFLVGIAVLGTVAGDLLKAAGMRKLGEVDDFRPGAMSRLASLAARSTLLWLAIGGYTLSFFGFLALVSIEDLSFAAPATAVGVVVETLLAKLFLREAVSARRWAGAGLVTAGVFLLGG